MAGRRISDVASGPPTKKAKHRDSERGELNPPTSLARWCEINRDGEYVWDKTKIRTFPSQDEQEDAAWMQYVLEGRLLNAKVYPLVFDHAQPDDAPDVIKLRTLPYFTKLLADADANGTLFQSLSNAQKRIVAVGLRDLYIAASTGLLDEHDKHTLQKMMDIFHEGLYTSQVAGTTISFHPSRDFTMLKFIEGLEDKVDGVTSRLYAQVMKTPKLFVVFVNPKDLSYHNFENIVPLDKWFEAKAATQDVPHLTLSLNDPVKSKPSREVFTCKLQGDAATHLKDLSMLDLYVPPLNNNTRGGERFIFHSALLSKALTKAVASSGLLDKIANGRLKSTFEFVNYVFRCNKFAPGDGDFQSHLDTPYYDSGRSQASKYTLLIYLNAGHGNPMLRLKDVSIHEVEDMTCVIFDQRYEHEGRPFVEGMKAFIRTELVFTDSELEHDSRISSLFSEACYMTGQSMFDQSLASHAHECFERANSLHWGLEAAVPQRSVYLHKKFHGFNFLTNGYNYWFQKRNGVDVKTCALVASLDYFNCKVGNDSFRSLTTSTTVRNEFSSTEDIWLFLSLHAPESKKGLRRLASTDVESLIKKSSDKPFVGSMEDWDGDDEEFQDFEEDGDGCCPTHSFPMFNPWKSLDVMRCYGVCCDFTRKLLFGAPLLILNEEIAVNEDNIVVDGDKIFILQQKDGKVIGPINFAACWSDGMPEEFVVVDKEIAAPRLLLPPITLHESPSGFQLSLDFFRNDWMVQVDDSHSIVLPDIVEKPDGEEEFSARVSDVNPILEALFENGPPEM